MSYEVTRQHPQGTDGDVLEDNVRIPREDIGTEEDGKMKENVRHTDVY